MSLQSELNQENDLLRINSQLCNFSGDGRFLAVAFQTNLVIKKVKTLRSYHSFVFADIIEYLEWSPNSNYVLCANFKKAVVQIYSIAHPEWKCKLTQGSAGLQNVNWSPDSKHFLTLSDFNIQLSVWSLENRSVLHITNLKSSVSGKLNFSSDGSRLALIITNDGTDRVEIYKTHQWRISRKLICERLDSIDGICWSSNYKFLVIWCSSSNKAKLIIYSVISEKTIAVFCPSKREVLSDQTFIYGKELLGISNVKWNPSGQLLAIVGLNEMVVLLNHVTWKPILKLCLDPVITRNNTVRKVYKERIVETRGSTKYDISGNHILDENQDSSINIDIGKKDYRDKLSIAKIDILEFSACGQYLAIRHQLYPTTLWIWNIIVDCVDYLLLQNAVVAVKWSPICTCLLVFCECTHVFEWTPAMATCLPVPRCIITLNAQWHPQGKSIILYGYNKAVIHYVEHKAT